jgi:peptidyl-prolyl cis-trans isomerase D
MALIGKIRQKSWLVVGFIMVALVLFIISDKLFSGSSQSQKQFVGEINGNEIEYSKFNAKFEEELEQTKAQKNGEPIKDYEIAQIRNRVWQQFVTENTILVEAKKLGLSVSDAELVDMVQGKNILDDIKKNFSDASGQFSKDRLIEYLKAIDKPSDKDQNYSQLINMKAMWMKFEASLPSFRLQEKYTDLFTKSAYVTKAELEKANQMNNAKAIVKYVYVPFSSISDSTVKVSDDQIKEYLSAHKKQFEIQEDQAFIDYVQFAFSPSKEDSAKAYTDITNLAPLFQNSINDSSFVNMNTSGENGITLVKPSELPMQLKNSIPNPESGKVYGPFFEYGTFQLFKLGKTKEDDLYSIKASHILFKPNGNTVADTIDAMNRAVEVLARIKKGENFEMLASQFGTDGTKNQGGDLGVFQEKQMVPEFNNAVFGKGTVGLLNDVVKTQFGFHVIKITEPKVKYNKQLVYCVEKSIVASPQTKDLMVNLSRNFKEDLEKTKNVDEVLKKQEYKGLTKTANIMVSKQSAYVGALSNAEGIVRWAFDKSTDKGDVSDFLFASNKVVAIFVNKKEKGSTNFDDVKEAVTPFAKNLAKGDMIVAKIKQLGGKSIDEVASGYGAQAMFKAADTLSLTTTGVAGTYDPTALGFVFGLKAGKKTDAFKTENGVIVAEKLTEVPAQPVADYTVLKQGAKQNLMYKNMGGVSGALNELLKVEDNRFLFY